MDTTVPVVIMAVIPYFITAIYHDDSVVKDRGFLGINYRQCFDL